jgi:carbamoyl-phosphate synthase large subunit
MAVASNDQELRTYLERAARVSPEHPTVISKFLDNAKEIEFDAVADRGEIVAYAISEHVENAGVHSGDATLVFPAQRTYLETIRRIRRIATRIASSLNISGPFNIQFIAKDNRVRVIECNLRASRSFPFVSKVINQNFIELATRIIMRQPYSKPDKRAFELNHVGVKAPEFSFTRLEGADPTLGVEMASTGEVGCLGADFNEAFIKSLHSVGFPDHIDSILLSVGAARDKGNMLAAMRTFHELGVTLYATEGTARFLTEHNIPCTRVAWPEPRPANGDDNDTPAEHAHAATNPGPPTESGADPIALLRKKAINLVINIPSPENRTEITNGYRIRRAAVDYNARLITNRQIAERLAEAMHASRIGEAPLRIRSWAEYAGN